MGSIGIYAVLANDVGTRAHTQTHTYTHNQMHTLQCRMGWGTVRLSCIRLEDEMVHMGTTHTRHTHRTLPRADVCVTHSSE